MVYADSDFFLALVKESDWLKERAVKRYQEHKGRITTSVATIMELLLIAGKFDLDAEHLLAESFALVETVEGIDKQTALVAAHLIKKKGLNVFDAFHAAFCGNDAIISSDKAFDSVGMKRVQLEKA